MSDNMNEISVRKIPKKTVTVIEPRKSLIVDKEKHHQKRVAAYCRVSTDSEEQLTSYNTQKKVYTGMIARNPEWELVGIYADEAVIIGLKPPSINGRRFSPIFIYWAFPDITRGYATSEEKEENRT